MSEDVELSVDLDVCEANAVCVGIDPAMFELDDDDQLHVLVAHPTGEQLERARRAVANCPKQALTLKE